MPALARLYAHQCRLLEQILLTSIWPLIGCSGQVQRCISGLLTSICRDTSPVDTRPRSGARLPRGSRSMGEYRLRTVRLECTAIASDQAPHVLVLGSTCRVCPTLHACSNGRSQGWKVHARISVGPFVLHISTRSRPRQTTYPYGPVNGPIMICCLPWPRTCGHVRGKRPEGDSGMDLPALRLG